MSKHFVLILVVLLQCLNRCPALSAALDENTETVKTESSKAISRLTTDLKETIASSDEKLNDVYSDGKTSILFKYVMKNGLGVKK